MATPSRTIALGLAWTPLVCVGLGAALAALPTEGGMIGIGQGTARALGWILLLTALVVTGACFYGIRQEHAPRSLSKVWPFLPPLLAVPMLLAIVLMFFPVL